MATASSPDNSILQQQQNNAATLASPYLGVTTPNNGTVGNNYTPVLSYYAQQQQVNPTAQQQSPQATLSSAANQASNIKNLLGSGTDFIDRLGASYLGTGATGLAGTNAFGSGIIASAGENAALSSSVASTAGAGELEGIIGNGVGSIGEGGSLITGGGGLTSASLSGIMGAAGLGYFGGGLLASALGENALGGSIGGAIGAAGGMALGAEIGWLGGPLGALAGGVIGSIAGGLFGGSKPSDSTQVGGVSLMNGQVNPVYANQESDTGSKFSQTNRTIADNGQKGASNFASWLIANGATPNANTQKYNPNLVIKIGSRDGLQIGTQNEGGGSNALNYTSNLSTSASTQDLVNAINQTVMKQYDIPADLQAKISQMNLGSFYTPNYNPNMFNSNSVATNNSLVQTNNIPEFTTPTVAGTNTSGKGILQIPNNSTGQ